MNVALILVAAMSTDLSPIPGAPADPLDGLILVRARVAEVGAPGADGSIRSTQEITHVYCGPEPLLGRSFVDTSRGGEDSIGASAHPPLRRGEIGLWSLSQADADLIVKRFPQLPFAYRAREGQTPRYDAIRALAEAIERVARAAPAGRPALLEELARSRTSEVSAWAISALATSRPEGFAEFLDKLADDEQLAIGAQVALDEALEQVKGKAWTEARRRRDLLARWVADTPSEHEANLALNRLENAAQQGGLAEADLLDLLGKALKNDKLTVETRRQCLWAIGRASRRGQAAERAFGLLAEQVRSAAEPRLRLTAALAMKTVPLDEARRRTVRKLVDEAKDADLKAALRRALEP